jgi:predicted ester cyclase
VLFRSAAFKAFWAGNHASLPDLVVDDDYVIVAQGDMVAAWWYMGGTFENEWAGIPPTGEPWGINVLDLWRFEDGKIVEAWDNFDTMNFMQQLGAVPAEEPVGPQASWHLELGESDLTREEIFELTMTHGQAVDESDVEALDVTFSPDMVFHSPMVGETDLDGLRAEVTGITTFLGDPVTVLEPEFFVTEGDLMFVFYEMGGSFEGEFLGIPPNGNPLMFAGVNVYRYGDKQAEEFWYMFDTLGLFGQMTVEPAE